MPIEQYSDYATWLQFFKDAFILPEFSQTYAQKFSEHRIRFDMLNDLDKQLLNELGITAVGDCLSILKHSKAVLSRMEEKNKDFDLSDSQAVNEVNQSKTRCQVVKRIIKTYLNDAPVTNDLNIKAPSEKPLNNSMSSSNLVSRLVFNSNSNQNVVKPIVTFNEDSLSKNKVLVSSTTNEETINSSSKGGRGLKRKLNDVDIGDDMPLEYQGTLKEPTLNVKKTIVKLNKSSLNDHSLLISSDQTASKTIVADFSRLNSPNLRITKTIQATKSTNEGIQTRTAELSNLKVSVFKRIKTVNNTEIAVDEKPTRTSTISNSSMISLKKIKTPASAAITSRVNSKPSAKNNLKTTDIKSRLKFN